MNPNKIKNIVVIGDTHCGSTAAIMPENFKLGDGQPVGHSTIQRWLWEQWIEFWKFVDRVTDGKPYALVHNGDQIDGRHHKCTQLVSSNLNDQRRMFVELMKPKVEKAAAFYCIAGTAAHGGQSSEDEETCARELRAAVVDNEEHRFIRQDLWVELGKELIQFAHHIGTTSSQAYKSSPAMRLMAAMYGAAGEHGFRPPSIMVRSHAHDYIEVKRANCRVVVCPAWQVKTDWLWGKDTASLPIIGGLVIKEGQEGIHIREFARTPQPSCPVKL